ncbi:MAG: ABC transporter ATP-binding protein [Sulfolobaceae archaeon]
MIFLLKVNSISKRFGGFLVLDSVSLEIPYSRLTLLIGPNGSGKSTLVNVITGLYKPDSGRVYFDGKDITGWKPHEIFKLGIVRTFQNPQIFPNLSVLDNVILGRNPIRSESVLRSILKSFWIKEEEELANEAYKILKMLRLEKLWDRPAKELSGGQLKLLEIARALMARARVLLMDEPLAGINPQLAKEILKIITDLKKNMAILVIEHRLDIVVDYVDYVYAMSMGKIIASGSVNEVLNNPEVIKAYLG